MLTDGKAANIKRRGYTGIHSFERREVLEGSTKHNDVFTGQWSRYTACLTALSRASLGGANEGIDRVRPG